MMNNKNLIEQMSAGQEVFWSNPNRGRTNEETAFSVEDINEAEARLKRFAPLIMHYFPETRENNGIIESPLTEIGSARQALESAYECHIPGRMFLKRDSDLAVSGSVKARGGIYEVLQHTEKIAIENGLLNGIDDDVLKLTTKDARRFFSTRKVQVGSTGNLGLSIGIMSAALGYQAIIHMSSDASQWKKDLLRKKGAEVREYDGDYGEAVRCGRKLSEADDTSYFVDDENSRALFCGYAVAARRVAAQMEKAGVTVDADHPLMVYIPCGVGGAPGGITYGLKQIFGKNVYVYFAEPVQAPCMLLGLATERMGQISVQDIGLTGITKADGLAVGRCSNLVAREMRTLLNGEMTVQDGKLIEYLKILTEREQIFIEPSACAGFECAVQCMKAARAEKLEEKMENAVHIVWATGGSMVPENVRTELLK